jgi:hypothetical protein
VPELPMRFHLLGPDVKCSACGGRLTFIRVRLFADLYQCASDQCKRQVIHYPRKESKTCGYCTLSARGTFGQWTACGNRLADGLRPEEPTKDRR